MSSEKQATDESVSGTPSVSAGDRAVSSSGAAPAGPASAVSSREEASVRAGRVAIQSTMLVENSSVPTPRRNPPAGATGPATEGDIIVGGLGHLAVGSASAEDEVVVGGQRQQSLGTSANSEERQGKPQGKGERSDQPVTSQQHGAAAAGEDDSADAVRVAKAEYMRLAVRVARLEAGPNAAEVDAQLVQLRAAMAGLHTALRHMAPVHQQEERVDSPDVTPVTSRRSSANLSWADRCERADREAEAARANLRERRQHHPAQTFGGFSALASPRPRGGRRDSLVSTQPELDQHDDQQQHDVDQDEQVQIGAGHGPSLYPTERPPAVAGR